jgi:hypothetical protein
MTRQDYNRKIISKLSELIEKYPDLRFGQLLVDCDIIRQEPRADDILTIDPFNEESKITWERMKNNRFVIKDLYN